MVALLVYFNNWTHVHELGGAPVPPRGEITQWYPIGGRAKTYLWDYGDGTTSTERVGFHTYRAPGLYTVSLTACNDAGCTTDTRVDHILVYPIRTAGIERLAEYSNIADLNSRSVNVRHLIEAARVSAEGIRSSTPVSVRRLRNEGRVNATLEARNG